MHDLLAALEVLSETLLARANAHRWVARDARLLGMLVDALTGDTALDAGEAVSLVDAMLSTCSACPDNQPAPAPTSLCQPAEATTTQHQRQGPPSTSSSQSVASEDADAAVHDLIVEILGHLATTHAGRQALIHAGAMVALLVMLSRSAAASLAIPAPAAAPLEPVVQTSPAAAMPAPGTPDTTALQPTPKRPRLLQPAAKAFRSGNDQLGGLMSAPSAEQQGVDQPQPGVDQEGEVVDPAQGVAAPDFVQGSIDQAQEAVDQLHAVLEALAPLMVCEEAGPVGHLHLHLQHSARAAPAATSAMGIIPLQRTLQQVWRWLHLWQAPASSSSSSISSPVHQVRAPAHHASQQPDAAPTPCAACTRPITQDCTSCRQGGRQDAAASGEQPEKVQAVVLPRRLLSNLATCLARLAMEAASRPTNHRGPHVGVLGQQWELALEEAVLPLLLQHWEATPFKLRADKLQGVWPQELLLSWRQVCNHVLPGWSHLPLMDADCLDPLQYLREQQEAGSLGGPLLQGDDVTLVKTCQGIDGARTQAAARAGAHCSPRAVGRAVRAGYTLAARGLTARWGPAADVAEVLGRWLGLSVGANLYCTPPGSQGLAAHYDDHCVLVLQLSGCKRWLLAPPVDPLPLSYLPRLPVPPLGEGRQGVTAVELTTGDLLYIPRGWLHQAQATDGKGKEEVSVHVTWGWEVEARFTWAGLLHLATCCSAEAGGAASANTEPAARATSGGDGGVGGASGGRQARVDSATGSRRSISDALAALVAQACVHIHLMEACLKLRPALHKACLLDACPAVASAIAAPAAGPLPNSSPAQREGTGRSSSGTTGSEKQAQSDHQQATARSSNANTIHNPCGEAHACEKPAEDASNCGLQSVQGVLGSVLAMMRDVLHAPANAVLARVAALLKAVPGAANQQCGKQQEEAGAGGGLPTQLEYWLHCTAAASAAAAAAAAVAAAPPQPPAPVRPRHAHTGSCSPASAAAGGPASLATTAAAASGTAGGSLLHAGLWLQLSGADAVALCSAVLLRDAGSSATAPASVRLGQSSCSGGDGAAGWGAGGVSDAGVAGSSRSRGSSDRRWAGAVCAAVGGSVEELLAAVAAPACREQVEAQVQEILSQLADARSRVWDAAVESLRSCTAETLVCRRLVACGLRRLCE